MVAGCNITNSPESYLWMSNIGFLSPDSRCYSFDHRANGYARGEGIGVVLLKRLSAALRDGNTIRAVIRSTASNEDGRTPGIIFYSLGYFMVKLIGPQVSRNPVALPRKA
jgi:acyl transferase domain-containing protein